VCRDGEPWHSKDDWTFLMDSRAPILAPVSRAVVSHQASHVYHVELTSAGFGRTCDGSGLGADWGRSGRFCCPRLRGWAQSPSPPPLDGWLASPGQASGRKPRGRSECRALFGGFRMLVAVPLGTS
jgi:hypothetical protein